MKRTGILILSLLLTAISCGPRADIPKKKMIQIYYEISSRPYVEHSPHNEGPKRLYEGLCPLLDKYGYTEEEFINSINFYLRDPEKFMKILQAVETKLKSANNIFPICNKQMGIWTDL